MYQSETQSSPDWKPQPAQEKFLQVGCFEALYGGAAGGGKTDALLVDLASFVGVGYGSHYQALFLRRTFPELLLSALRRAHELYPLLGGVWKASESCFEFPKGERIWFAHCEHETSVTRYQGAQFQRVAFDEITTFTEYQYMYLISRIRSAHGVPCGIRAAGNPGGLGHKWVFKRWFPWLSKRKQVPLSGGVVRYFKKEGDTEKQVEKTEKGALGRTFIPASLADNPILEKNDPGYRTRLEALPRLERLRLLCGDWDAEPALKDYWDRDKVQVLRFRPMQNEVVSIARAWDFGASLEGDYSAGVLASLTKSGLTVIQHCEHFQGRPDTVHSRFEAVGLADKKHDSRVRFAIPKDPGAAGINTVFDYQTRYKWASITAMSTSGDKTSRFSPLSSRALAGNVAIVNDGTWDVDAFHDELEAFPRGINDDRVDASSDAYLMVNKSKSGSFIGANTTEDD